MTTTRIEMHPDDAEGMRALRDVAEAARGVGVDDAVEHLTRWAVSRVRLVVIDDQPQPVDLRALGVVGDDA